MIVPKKRSSNRTTPSAPRALITKRGVEAPDEQRDGRPFITPIVSSPIAGTAQKQLARESPQPVEIKISRIGRCGDGDQVPALAAGVDRSAVRGPAPLVGAIGRVCEVHHGSDLSERNAIRVQVGVYVLGNMVWRPTPPDIVADEVCHPDERLLVALRPSEAEAAQLSEVRVISGTGTSTRSASNQGSAKQHGDGQSGQPAR